MNQEQQGPMENLLDGLSQHAQALSLEERKAELRERGIDADKFLQDAHSIIAQHQKADRLAWMKVADQKAQRIASEQSTIESWLGKGEDAIRAAFERLLARAGSGPALAFRNKTQLTVDDMARILDDEERLRLRTTKPQSPGDTK